MILVFFEYTSTFFWKNMGHYQLPLEMRNKIKEIRKIKRISQKEVADACSIFQRDISNIENGTPGASREKAKKVLDFFQIDFELAEKLREEEERQDATDSLQEDKQEVSGIPSDYREIPVYNVRVLAGHGELPGVEAIKQLVQMPRMFLPSNGQIGIVRVEGDSMFPTISHGDHVAVEFGSGYTSDGLYLIRIDDSVFVKRLQREFGQIRIISDNTMYRELVVHPEDEQQFSLIGRVALILRVT